MRLTAIAILAALAASCTPPPTPPAALLTNEVLLDQGWSAADRARFTGTAQGSHLMPLPWFMALRRVDRDEAFAADQLTRYGYLPQPGALPVGFVADGSATDPQLGMTCAACHTGQLRYQGQAYRIDGGRADADFQAFLTDLGAASRATLAEPERFAAFAGRVLGTGATPSQTATLRQGLDTWTASYSSFMAASLPDPAWGPGRLDAFGMIFNRVTGLDLDKPGNLSRADAPVRYPFIWDAPKQDRTQWTGAAPNGTYLRGLARNTGEVFGVFGVFAPVPIPVRHALYRNAVRLDGLQALEETVATLRPPPWPAAWPLDQAQAVEGKALFDSQCAGCHGLKPSAIVRHAWATPVMDVGTDRRTFDNAKLMASPGVLTGTQQPPVVGDRLTDPAPKVSILSNAVIGTLLRGALLQDAGVRRAIARDLEEDRLPLRGAARGADPVAAVASATQDLYRPVPGAPGAAYEARVLTGIWAAGPYLHNGSVPTLWELLQPARARMTRFAVGHRGFDPVNVGLETAPAPGRAVFVVDAATGNGNAGHEYGTALSDPQKRALIEYLKTL